MIDDREMLLSAWNCAALSGDPSTQMGAVVCAEGFESGTHNHFPAGAPTWAWFDREIKYSWVTGAIEHGLDEAEKYSKDLTGGRVACPVLCSPACAERIVAHGIARYIFDAGAMARIPDRWAPLMDEAREILEAGGVMLVGLPTPEGKPRTLFDGGDW